MIRGFKEKDSTRCCEIINTCIKTIDGLNEAARNFLYSKNVPEILSRELKSFYTVVFEKNGIILSLGALDGNEIKRVYIDPAFQRKGIGSAIMKALEAKAKILGIKRLKVKSSPSAETFYHKSGYKFIKKEKMTKGKATFQFINMEKELK